MAQRNARLLLLLFYYKSEGRCTTLRIAIKIW